MEGATRSANLEKHKREAVEDGERGKGRQKGNPVGRGKKNMKAEGRQKTSERKEELPAGCIIRGKMRRIRIC